MRKILFATAALLGVVTAGAAFAQLPRVAPENSGPGSSAAALRTLLEEWDRIGFLPPSKPAQYRVYGRDGYVTSGPGYAYMVSLIRAASAESRAGHDGAALAKIAAARSLLGPSPNDNRNVIGARTPG